MLISDLLVKIGVDADLSKVKSFEAGVGNVAKTAAIAGAAITGLVGGLTAFVKTALGGLDEIAQLSRVTGEATSNIQILGTIAETAGSSIQASNSSIEGLSRTIGEAANGIGLGARAFENYGLSARKSNGDIKSATEVMEELREKMKGMSEQQQIAMLSKLGIDKSMIQVLRMTNDEMAEARKNAEALTLGTGSQQGADEAAALQDSLTNVAQMVRAVSEYVALQLSPAIREAVEVFKSWFIVNNDIIKENLAGFAKGVAKVFTFLGGLAKAIDNVISHTVGWKVALAAVATVFGMLSASSIIAMAPIYAIIGLVSALFLAVDDLLTYMEGGESLLGDFWDPFVTAINFVKPYFLAFVELLKNNISSFVDSAGQTLNGILNVFKSVFSLIGALVSGDLDGIQESFKGLVTAAGDIFGGIIDMITLPFKTAFEQVKKMVGKYLDPVMDKVKSVKGFFGFGNDEPSDDEKQANIKKGLSEFKVPGSTETADAETPSKKESGWFSNWFSSAGDVAQKAQKINPKAISETAKAAVSQTKVEKNTNTNNVTTNIHVTGADNPQETARAVSDASVSIVKNVESLQVM